MHERPATIAAAPRAARRRKEDFLKRVVEVAADIDIRVGTKFV
jgi:hypothetical protein